MTADIEDLLDDLLAGKALPAPSAHEPGWVRKLREWVAEREETEQQLSESRRALDRITATLMRLAALDFSEMPVAR